MRQPRFTIVLNTLGALRRMFGVPVEVSLAEAYIRGDFDIEGDMFAASELLEAFGKDPWSPGELLALVGCRIKSALNSERQGADLRR